MCPNLPTSDTFAAPGNEESMTWYALEDKVSTIGPGVTQLLPLGDVFSSLDGPAGGIFARSIATIDRQPENA
jgi:hypothetical protein